MGRVMAEKGLEMASRIPAFKELGRLKQLPEREFDREETRASVVCDITGGVNMAFSLVCQRVHFPLTGVSELLAPSPLVVAVVSFY